MSEAAPWLIHEDYVASLYRRLGYVVTHNVNVDGQQVDLICENWLAGIGRTRLLVDCKHTRLEENKSVSKDDVDQFIYTFKNRADSGGWTAGIMVSNRPFSQYAKAAAAKHPSVHLKTIDELHEEVLRIRAYLHQNIQQYEESNRFFDFVQPYGSINDPTPLVQNSSRLLEEITKDWLRDPDNPQFCLFGDFGTGKTTFLEYLHYTLAKRYLNDVSVRIPLLLPLRKFYEAADHEEMIAQFFMQECGVSLQYSLFHHFLQGGRLLLLLDGFDEMGAKSDPTIRKANYLKLAPLIEGRSKVLISCRPAYFISLQETKSVFSFVNKQVGFSPALNPGPITEHLYGLVQESNLSGIFAQTRTALSGTLYADVDLFDKRQIKTYLKKHKMDIVNASKGTLDDRALFKRIQEIYDLEDLAQRPLLLKLIVLTLPLFQPSSEGGYEIQMADGIQKVPDITPSVLYSVYTEKELEREYTKGKVRWLIERQDKVSAIAAIAFEMFRRDVTALDKGALSNVVQQVFPGSEEEQAYYLTDIHTCSFLSRDSQDSARFTHKSFMEYYAAVYIRLAMNGQTNAQDLLSIRPLSDEVAFFLGDSIASAPNAEVLAAGLFELFSKLSAVLSPMGTCIQNILNTLNYARRPVSPLKKVKADSLVYRKLDIKEYVGEDLTAAKIRVIRSAVSKWIMTDSEVRLWEIEESRFDELVGKSLDCRAVRIWNSNVEACYFSMCNISFETWRSSEIRLAVFNDSCIVNAGALGPEWMPEKARLENCVIVGMNLKNPALSKCQFSNCTFLMCPADSTPPQHVNFKACRGVLLTSSSEPFREWGHGLDCIGIEQAQDFRRLSNSTSRTWGHFILHLFGTDGLPKSFTEIKSRLKQADLATAFARLKGRTAMVKSSGSPNYAKCKILKCNAHNLTLLNLESQIEFEPSLRKIALNEDQDIHISVDAD